MPTYDDNLVSQLMPSFFHRGSVDGALAHSPAVIGAIAGIRGMWPMNLQRAAGTASRMGSVMTLYAQAGGSEYGRTGWIPWADFDGAGYLNSVSADAEITAAEAYITGANRGLTLGGWINPAIAIGDHQGLITKWEDHTEKGYRLFIDGATSTLALSISVDGAAQRTMLGTRTLISGQWVFVAATFAPSTKMMVGVNGSWEEVTTSIPASIYDTSADLQVGHCTAGAGFTGYTGKMSQMFLACMQYTDTEYLDVIYQLTAPLFGQRPRL